MHQVRHFEEAPWRRTAAKLLTRDEARRIAANIVNFSEVVGLVMIVPREPIWSLRGLVLRIGSTGPADPAHRGQALLISYEPTIRSTAHTEIVIGAPRIGLRLNGFCNADDRCERAHDD